MIGGAVTGGGGPALGRHLVNPDHNDDVRMGASHGLMADTVDGQVAELTDMAEASGHKHPLRHVHASPPPGTSWNRDQWEAYWALYERAMGLEGCAFSEAIHDKPGTDGRPPHRHRVYLALTERGTLVRIGNDYARQEAVSRIVEADTGAAFVKGAHNIRAATIARQLGRDDVANAMKAAGLLDGIRARADLMPGARAQQERTGIMQAAVAAAALAAWRQSDTGPALLHALAAHGLHLAVGDKPGVAVVLDGSGGAHSLARLLAQATKSEGGTRLPAADVAARLDGMALPTVAQAHQAMAPPLPPDKGPPSPDAPKLPGGGQVRPGAADITHAYIQASHGGDAPAPTAAQVAPGAALEDAGPGPGEPPGPGAHPDELARYTAALAAYQDRKASAWVRWLAQQAAGPQAASGGGGHAGHAEITQGRHGRAAEQAYGWIRAAQESGSATRPAAGAAPGTSEDGDDHAGGGDGAAAWGHDTGNPHADRAGVEPAARPDNPASIGRAEPDNGNPVRLDDAAGIATEDGAAARAPAADARQGVARRAAEARLAHGLAGHPDAMDRLRQARQELDPAWRAARDAQRRIRDDQARIDAILSTHPHPDPASRDPAARASAYAHAISDCTRQRTATVDAAEALAAAAVQGRSRATRILASIGIANGAQRQAESMVARAVALGDAAAPLPSRDDYTRARADGKAHAYAAQQTTATWEQRPEVAAAMEQHRLNQAVQQAMAAGDQAINAAVDAGDPAAARAIIRAREEQQERRRAKQERLEQLRRGTPGHDGTKSPPPGKR